MTIALIVLVVVFAFSSSVYTIESQLDNADNNRVNPKFINKWLDEYFAVSGNRVPPRMFIEWISFGLSVQLQHPSDRLSSNFEDLKPFKMPGMSNEYIRAVSNVIDAYGKEVLPLTQHKMMELSAKMPLHVGSALDLLKNENLLNPRLILVWFYSIPMSRWLCRVMIIPSNRTRGSMMFLREIPLSLKRLTSIVMNILFWVFHIHSMPSRHVSSLLSGSNYWIQGHNNADEDGLVSSTFKEQRQAANELSNWELKENRAVFRERALESISGKPKRRDTTLQWVRAFNCTRWLSCNRKVNWIVVSHLISQ